MVSGQATPTLELLDLRRRHGDVVALDGLTFTVTPGHVFGFLGSNGAGKTTAMRAVFGLTALYRGEVRWRGVPIGERERRRFGYMPQARGLYPGMQILDQLVFLGRLHGLSPEPALDGIPDGREVLIKQRPVGGTSSSTATFSGALAQLVGVARRLTPVAGQAALTNGIAIPIRGVESPPKSLATRFTGLGVDLLI